MVDAVTIVCLGAKSQVEDMVDAVTIVCLEAKSQVEDIFLFLRTVVCCIDAIAVNNHEQLLTACGRFYWFSIALAESCDLRNTAQLTTHVRGIYEGMVIT